MAQDFYVGDIVRLHPDFKEPANLKGVVKKVKTDNYNAYMVKFPGSRTMEYQDGELILVKSGKGHWEKKGSSLSYGDIIWEKRGRWVQLHYNSYGNEYMARIKYRDGKYFSSRAAAMKYLNDYMKKY